MTEPTNPGQRVSGEKSAASVENGLDIEAKQEDPIKEGTPRAYLALVGGFLGQFISLGWVNCIALFQAQYEDNQLKDYSSSEVSWITSTEFFLMLFLSPGAGYLFDNFGPRVPIFVGGLMQIFGLMMTSLSTKYYQILLSQSIVAGIGTSLILNPCMTAPMSYFRRARALAAGSAVAGSSLGGVVFPLMVSHLLPQIGFAWTMRACAFFTLGLWIIVLLVISSNISHARRKFNIQDYVKVFREPNFIILCAFVFFLYWALLVPMNYLSVSAISRGMSTSMALNLVPIMNAASFMGRIFPNLIADRYGRFNVMIAMVLFTSIIEVAVWLPGTSNAAIIVFAVLFGVGSGACIGLLPVITMTLSPSAREVGFRLGAALAIAGISTLTGPPIAGAIATKSGGLYDHSFIYSAASGFLSTGFICLLRGRVIGWGVLAESGRK